MTHPEWVNSKLDEVINAGAEETFADMLIDNGVLTREERDAFLEFIRDRKGRQYITGIRVQKVKGQTFSDN